MCFLPINHIVTRLFQSRIDRYYDNLDDVGDIYSQLWYISLNTQSGYDQVSVREKDEDKLAFYGLNINKYCGLVIPFDPTNNPTFYTTNIIDFIRNYI